MKRDGSRIKSHSSHGLIEREQPGYYPGYQTLTQQDNWDESTRKVVTKRVASMHRLQFFAPAEAALLQAVTDRLLPQDDRVQERRIPIIEVIDERLAKNALIGFRYDDMPPDRNAYLLGLRAIEEMALERFKLSFLDLSAYPRELILKSLHDGNPDPGVSIWKQMPVGRFWTLIMEDCVNAYYSHPWAWDEIGYGGPAYPRGYMRLENGQSEPWESDEFRYVWHAPADSVSDLELSEHTRAHSSSLLEGTR